ncbi:MAG: hypothetical protein HY913_04390 [Desulfomonile tiedjei]|nr:hypothetical protein [Desulfomonile tiedjei]
MPHSKIVIKSDEKRIIYGSVYAPMLVDTQGEMMKADEIEAMAHRFMLSGRLSAIDTDHNLVSNGTRIVESFIARQGDPDFEPGEWVIGVKVFDDSIWDSVKKGELNGFSFYGLVNRSDAVVSLSQPVRGSGTTEPSAGGPLPTHDHTVTLVFNEQASVEPTYTNEALNHRHFVSRTTATEITWDHAHRLILDTN